MAWFSFQRKPRQSHTGFILFVVIVLLVRSFFISPFRIPSGSMIPSLKTGDFIIASKYHYGWSSYSVFLGGYLKELTGYFSGKILQGHFPDRGDVVVFTKPNDARMDYIKRVVGLPGDTVQMIKGRLYLNGAEVPLQDFQDPEVGPSGEHEEYSGSRMSPYTKGTVYQATLPRKDGSKHTYTVLKQLPFGQGGLDDSPLHTVPEDCVFVMGDNWDDSGDSRLMEDVGFIHKDFLLAKPLFVFFSLDTRYMDPWKPWLWPMVLFSIRYKRLLYMPIH